jgi:predicted SnoaL-like aldol condensation-catalyzing enzyme
MSNKELVKAAITGVFVDRDVTVLDKYFDANYIQHNPHIPNGLDALRQIIPSLKPEFKYVTGIITEDGEFVMIHGHYTGWAETGGCSRYFQGKKWKIS